MNPNEAEQDEATDAAQGTSLEAEARARVDDLKRRVAGLEDEIEAYIQAAGREARGRAAQIVAQAEREAEEIRADSKAVVDEARDRVNELMRLRQALFATLRDTLSDFEGAVTRAEEERTFPEASAQTESEGAPPERAESARPEHEQDVDARLEQQQEGDPPPEQAKTTSTMGPLVEVQVGPLKDFSAVNVVERAFDDLPATRGVYLRTFDDGTAVLHAFGVNVNTLLNSMRASFPIPFILRSADVGKLVIQVDEFAPGEEA
jgi:hypothetical protein